MDSFATRFQDMSAGERAVGAGEGGGRERWEIGVRGARVGGRRGRAERWRCGIRMREGDGWGAGSKVEKEIRILERNNRTVVFKDQW